MAHATHVPTGSPAFLYKLTSLRLAHNAKISAHLARSQKKDYREEHYFSHLSSHPFQTTKDFRTPPTRSLQYQELSGLPRGIGAAHPTDPSQVTDSLFAEWSTNRDEYTDFVDRIEKEQEIIRDAREDLLGSRFRLQVQRRELLKAREKTATQAGATFDRIRQHLLAINLTLPYDIETAISAAEQLRNELGDREVEYDEAEKGYNLEEWEYTQKESRFIEDMCGATPVPNDVTRSVPPVEFPDGATRFSLGRQEIENMVAEAEGDVLHELVDIDGALVGDGEFSEAPSTVAGDVFKPYGGSDDQHSTSTHDLTADTSKSLLFTERELAATRQKWAGTRRSIDEWLLHALELSRFEKLRFQTCLSEHTEMEEWWSLVDQNWYPDSPSGSRHHTDDTSVSGEALSESMSSNALHNMFDVSDIHESAAEGLSELPLLGQDRVLDAFDEVNFPADIEPLDLVDWPSSPLKSKSRSSRRRYGIGRHASSSRTGSYPDFSTCSTIEEESASTMPNSNVSEQRGKNSTSFSDASLEHGNVLQNSYASRENSLKDVNASPSFMSVKVGHEATLESARTSLSVDNVPDNARPNSDALAAANDRSDDDSRTAFTNSRNAEDDKISAFTSKLRPLLHDWGTFNIEHYIVVQDTEPWTFPLLRLMASPSNSLDTDSMSQKQHRLEALPFVASSDAPLRLPGPSKYF